MNNMFPFTEKGAALVTRLRVLRLESTETALCRLVYAEAEALAAIPPVGRVTRSRVQQQRIAAEEFYVEEIYSNLSGEGPEQLNADDILCYRRKAGAWAIAQRILAAEEAAKKDGLK